MKGLSRIKADNRAQASLEMAIFGSLILMAMVTLFTYSQKLNDEQYLTMQAFRGALSKAKEVKGLARYVALDHRRFASGDFFRKGSRETVSGSGVVFWGKPEVNIVGQVNIIEGSLPQIETGDIGETTIWKIDDGGEHPLDAQITDEEFIEDSTETMQKTEDSRAITTTHTIDMDESITITFDDGTEVSQPLAGKHRSYTWTTPH